MSLTLVLTQGSHSLTGEASGLQLTDPCSVAYPPLSGPEGKNMLFLPRAEAQGALGRRLGQDHQVWYEDSALGLWSAFSW